MSIYALECQINGEVGPSKQEGRQKLRKSINGGGGGQNKRGRVGN